MRLSPGRMVLVWLLGTSACGDSTAVGSAGETAELRIAVAPVNAATWSPLFQVVQGGAALESSTPLTLALGDDYPSEITVALDNAWVIPCGAESGRLEISSVTSVPGIAAARGEGDSFVVQTTDEAQGELRVQGILHRDDSEACEELQGAASVAFDLRVPVRVIRPRGASVRVPESCADADALRIQSGARFDPLASEMVAAPLDADGVEFYPSNASQLRAVEVVVRAASTTTLALDVEADGLSSLHASGPPDDVTITWEDDQLLQFEMVDAAAVEAIDLRFALLGHGGGDVELESGGTYGELGWSRVSSSIGVAVERLVVDGETLCTSPRPQDFELISHTADTCPAYDAFGHGDYFYGAAVLPLSADMLVSGECRIEVRAAGFDGGDGLASELAVVVHNAEGLHRFDGRD